MKTVKQLILEAFIELRNNQQGKRGICYSVSTYLHTHTGEKTSFALFERFIDHLTPEWNHSSGDIVYPVPHRYLDPKEAFKEAAYHVSFWQGEYGNKRKQLLQFLIDNIDAMNDDGSINEQHVITQSTGGTT